MYSEIVPEKEKKHMSKCLSKKKCNSSESSSADEEDAYDDCDEHKNVPVSGNDPQLDWVFLEEVPDYMKCTIICCNVYEAPQLLTCCGRSICKKCIELHLNRAAALTDQKPSCPVCRKEDFKWIENTTLQQSIDQLKVLCPYKSSGCGWTGTLRNGKLHLKECDIFPMDCPNGCGCKFERCKFPDHLSKCPLQYVNCSFEEVGCSTGESEMFLRGEITQKHSVKNLHHHLLRTAQFNTRVSCEYRSILTSFQSKYDNNIKEIDEDIRSQKKALTVLKSTIHSLEENLKETQHKFDLVRQESEKEMAICLRELKKRGEQAKNTSASYLATIDQVRALPLPTATGISYPPVTFTINHFKKRMTTDDMWLSPPFYTHVSGYKMCLSVYPNGQGCIKGVSVNIHFMTGEFDDHLNWPFPGAIFTITAISQYGKSCNQSVHLQLIKENTRYIRSRHIDGAFGCGYGATLLDHRDLSLFLIPNSDSLEIMVYRIQFLPL